MCSAGEDFISQRIDWQTRYTFSAKEKDKNTGYHYPIAIGIGARYYDSEVSVWLSVDPMADEYPGLSPYMYAEGNPVMMVDPNGMATIARRNEIISPYYDKNGVFLGTDEGGFTGEIFITTKEKFNNYKNNNGNARTFDIQKDVDVRPMKDIHLSAKAEAEITNHVLSNSDEVDVSKLHNSSVTVFSGKSKNGVLQGYNDPEIVNRLRTDEDNEGNVKILARSGGFSSLGSVEAILNYVGVHEFEGHGIKGYSGGKAPGGTNYIAYLAQYRHHTFSKLSGGQQKEIMNRIFEYMEYENNSLYYFHKKSNTSLYKSYINVTR
ncbi:MAG: RHS repeat-associated core domain-containing protein [Bacteroidales bacterium]|nr:RHS repeat-associated core domain-containing protein [Bacteroidales bacterium]